MNEDQIKDSIRVHFGLRWDIKLFTNPVGNGWMGEGKSIGDGAVIIKHPSRLSFGLCVGSADLIGWIIQNLIARFLAFEVKTKSGKPTEAQLIFLANVIAGGGVAGVARSIEDCEELLTKTPQLMALAIMDEARKCKFEAEPIQILLKILEDVI